MKLIKQLIITALLLFTGHQWGEAIWIFGKAKVAQFLIADAWQSTLETSSIASTERSSEPRVKPWAWSDSWPVARMQWKPAQVQEGAWQQDLYVLSGANGSSLAFGPGHLNGTAMPGEGLSVIAGHRDTHFRFLEYVMLNDVIRLQSAQGNWTSYKVLHMEVRHKEETPLLIDESQDGVLLVTCYPFDAVTPGGPLRYLVWAGVENTSENEANALAHSLSRRTVLF